MRLTKIRRSVLISLFVWAVLGPASFAQDASSAGDGSDIFDAGNFESGLEAGKQADKAAQLEFLYGLNFIVDGTFNYMPDNPANAESLKFYGTAFAKASKADIGSIFASIAYSQFVLGSSSSPEWQAYYQVFKPNLNTPSVEVQELHFSFDIGKLVFLRIGKQLLGWGASRIWSPADFVNIQARDAGAPLDLRSGKAGIRLHIPLAGANIFGFADFSQTIQNNLTQDAWAKTSYALRADAVILGWNIGLLGAIGPSSPARLGATASGSLLGFDLWGELGSRLEYNGYPFAIAFSVGGEKTFGVDKEWALRAEYFHQSSGHADTPIGPAQLAGGFSAYYWGYDYVWVELACTKLGVTWLGGALSGTLNCSDLSWQAQAKLNFSIPQFLPFSAIIRYNAGSEGREFTLPANRQYWTFELLSVISL